MEIAEFASTSGTVTVDTIAKLFNSAVMAKILIIGGFCGIITSWNSFLMGSSRAIFSLAESYIVPHTFAKVHPKYKTPVAALILVEALSIGLVFCGRGMLICGYLIELVLRAVLLIASCLLHLFV